MSGLEAAAAVKIQAGGRSYSYSQFSFQRAMQAKFRGNQARSEVDDMKKLKVSSAVCCQKLQRLRHGVWRARAYCTKLSVFVVSALGIPRHVRVSFSGHRRGIRHLQKASRCQQRVLPWEILDNWESLQAWLPSSPRPNLQHQAAALPSLLSRKSAYRGCCSCGSIRSLNLRAAKMLSALRAWHRHKWWP